ncbi:MAG: hypothetical protein MJA83_16380, partial [Gammaproteobacteria bacterium]|nr:hypothetical protein [Gammaproteobacteria bacterium]
MNKTYQWRGRAACRLLLSFVIALSGTPLLAATFSPIDENLSQFAHKMNANALAGGIKYDRYIVKYKAGAPQQFSTNAMSQHLDSVAANAGLNVNFERRLGTGAHLVRAAKHLGGGEAESFML